MSTDDPASYTETETDTHHTVEKDLLVTAYASDWEYNPDNETEANYYRQFAEDAFGHLIDTDIWDMETSEHEEVSVSLSVTAQDPRWDNERTITPSLDLSGRKKRVIKNAVQEDIIDPSEIDWLDVDIRDVTDTDFTTSVDTLLDEAFMTELDSLEIPPEDYTIYDTSVWTAKWSREVGLEGPMAPPDETKKQQTRVTTKRREIARRKVLRPQGEREPCDRFEGEDKVYSMQVNIDMEASTETEIEQIEKTIAGAVMTILKSSPVITETRVTDCEKTTVAKGACYNV